MTFNTLLTPSSPSDEGFTLIEVMVSLAVMALIVTVAFSGLRIGLNSWDRGSRRIEKLEERANVERLLNRQLALASPMPLNINDRMTPLFRGTDSRLEFISDYSLADGQGDFRKIDYAIKDGHFLYGEKRLPGYVPSESENPPTQTLSEFRSVRFRFLAMEPSGDFKWVDDWKPEMGLPTAVEAKLNQDTLMIRLVNRLVNQ